MKIPIRKTPQTPANMPETHIPATRKNHSSPAKIKELARSEEADTAKNGNNLARPRAGRRIDATTIAAIARLCAKQLTESESCHRLGIKPQQWFAWKSRHKRSERFAELLEAYRADRIEHLIERIEKSADGVDVKFPDFRAALALLKFQDQKRFGDSPAVAINPMPVIQISIIHEQLKKVIGFDCDADVKALPSAPVGGTLPAPEQKGGEHHEN